MSLDTAIGTSDWVNTIFVPEGMGERRKVIVE
jgi:hypothetical protein